MKIIQSILTKNDCYTAGRKITVKGLMLHSVGCPQPSASVFVKRWNKPDGSACVHAFIDGNTGEVYQTLPWNHRGWHGGGSSNNTHIGVEMCEPACIKYTGGSSFTCSNVDEARAVAQRTYDTAVQLFAHLCKEYKLDPLRDGVIVSHREGHQRGIASNHGDPEHLWNQLGMGYTMATFRKAVKAAMGGTVTVEAPKPEVKNETLYRVQIGAFGKKANAETQLVKVKAAGFETYMVQVDGLWKIQTGAFSKRENADAQLAKVKAAGFDAFISTKNTYSLTQFVKDIQTAIGVDADGVAGAETLSKTVTLSAHENQTHPAVEAVQKRLTIMGYEEVGAVDGIAGNKFTSAVAHYQQDNGCVVDGVITAGNKTWKCLLEIE